MVTLKDIAQEANVSVMTVSNVVNGNLSKVSKEKAAQIQEIIRQRNYVQNASARNLAKAIQTSWPSCCAISAMKMR